MLLYVILTNTFSNIYQGIRYNPQSTSPTLAKASPAAPSVWVWGTRSPGAVTPTKLKRRQVTPSQNLPQSFSPTQINPNSL